MSRHWYRANWHPDVKPSLVHAYDDKDGFRSLCGEFCGSLSLPDTKDPVCLQCKKLTKKKKVSNAVA